MLGPSISWLITRTRGQRNSWRGRGLRADLVTLLKDTKGDRVKDEGGQSVPSQRLSTGELVSLARDIRPFAAKRFAIEDGTPPKGEFPYRRLSSDWEQVIQRTHSPNACPSNRGKAK